MTPKLWLKSKRSQVTIYGIIMVVALLIVFVSLLPVIVTAVQIVQSNPNVDDLTKLVVATIPVFMAIAILLVLLVYISR